MFMLRSNIMNKFVGADGVAAPDIYQIAFDMLLVPPLSAVVAILFDENYLNCYRVLYLFWPIIFLGGISIVVLFVSSVLGVPVQFITVINWLTVLYIMTGFSWLFAKANPKHMFKSAPCVA